MTYGVTYEAPTIRDLGDLIEITADVHHVTMGVAATAAASAPMTPNPPPGGGGGGGGGEEVQTAQVGSDSPATPDTGFGAGDTSPESTEGGGGGNEGVSTTGTVTAGSDSGRLPFTGLAAGLVALLGGLMSTVGLAIRRSLRRNSD